MKKTILFSIIGVCIIGFYFVIYMRAQTELSLAELKSDLDGMYQPLQTLSALQIPSAKRRLPQVAEAITLREDMLRSVAEHDHEYAVISAKRLLEIAPKHKDGTRVLKESGQIFFLLRESRDTVKGLLNREPPSSAPYQEVNFKQNTDTPSKELITYIQEGLSELGHYHSVVDGVSGSGTIEALNSFSEDKEKDQSLGISNETANQIAAEVALVKAKRKWQQTRFHDLNRAYELASEAVNLDPHFDRATILISDLDRAHEALAIVIGVRVLELGQTVISSAAYIHDSTNSVLTEAASLGIVSEMYAELKPTLDNTAKMLEPMQDSIDDSMNLISSYKGDRSKDFFESITEFVHIVRTGTDVLIYPSSNLRDYRQAGSDTVREYKKVVSRIEASIPDSAEIDETMSGLVKVFSDYVIFSDPKTEQIINNNIDLYAI